MRRLLLVVLTLVHGVLRAVLRWLVAPSVREACGERDTK
jgi:hypothetical protein